MPNNYDYYEPELDGDIALDKEVRGMMRNSYEPVERLRRARARRAGFESNVGRVRFDVRLQICGWNLGTVTVRHQKMVPNTVEWLRWSARRPWNRGA